jgi:hypothetical protein
VAEIKHLLFCRLLLSHATLLPAALRASSVNAFLSDPDVSDADLRDLCLQMEQPALQQIRDACADLTRDDNEEADLDIQDDPEDEEKLPPSKVMKKLQDIRMFDPRLKRPGKASAVPEKWNPKREDTREKIVDADGVMVDFGQLDDQGEYSKKKVRVKVCGRYIWNYASESAMGRSGWLQFSVIARSCSFFEAIELCRNWDEFFELNILSLFHYFPAAKWKHWSSHRLQQELLQQVRTTSLRVSTLQTSPKCWYTNLN